MSQTEYTVERLFKADSSRKRRGKSRIGRGSVGRVPAVYARADRYIQIRIDDYVHTYIEITCVWIYRCGRITVYISATATVYVFRIRNQDTGYRI
jgi:hypothetical protein